LARTALLILLLVGAVAAGYDALSVSGEWLIGAYKAVLSPLQGPNLCNFHPTCSQFTRGAIQSQGFFPGLLMGTDRLMRCNTVAWSYFDTYYDGGVIDGRMSDPVDNHIAWSRPPDELGFVVAAQADPARDNTGGSRALASPSLSFADYLYSSGEFRQAAGEYLRIRWLGIRSQTSDVSVMSPRLSDYAGLMAGESYLQAGDVAKARHAFSDVGSPPVRDFGRYGLARTFFAEADYVGTRAALDTITSERLARQSRTLSGWTLFRQHRFRDGASALGTFATDEPSRRLAAMDGRDIRRRSRLASTLLSAILPGAGQLYSGRAGDGAYTFLTVAGTGLVAWWFAAEPTVRDRTRVKVSIFSVVTALFYAGNVYGANVAARDYNLLQERRYVQRADSLFERVRLQPDYQPLLDSATVDSTQSGSE